ncbi:MAG: hypothetical protein HYZ81_11280 [Nitrospinae bacterium]|nr:hypothetical protein [Nitrospinota bacterium]
MADALGRLRPDQDGPWRGGGPSRAARLVTRPLAVKVHKMPRRPSNRVDPTMARPEFKPIWTAMVTPARGTPG